MELGCEGPDLQMGGKTSLGIITPGNYKETLLRQLLGPFLIRNLVNLLVNILVKILAVFVGQDFETFCLVKILANF